MHLDAGYDSAATRELLAERGLTGEIARKGVKVPVQATKRWHVERTNSWHNALNRLQRCYERKEDVIHPLHPPTMNPPTCATSKEPSTHLGD